MIRVYIAGPMASVGGNFNFPLFDHVAKRLRATGKCEVFNPAEYAREKIGPLEMIMKMDKKELKTAVRKLLKDEIIWICDNADVLLMLPNWRVSLNAGAERAVAIALDIMVRECPNVILFDKPLESSDIDRLIED